MGFFLSINGRAAIVIDGLNAVDVDDLDGEVVLSASCFAEVENDLAGLVRGVVGDDFDEFTVGDGRWLLPSVHWMM